MTINHEIAISTLAAQLADAEHDAEVFHEGMERAHRALDDIHEALSLEDGDDEIPIVVLAERLVAEVKALRKRPLPDDARCEVAGRFSANHPKRRCDREREHDGPCVFTAPGEMRAEKGEVSDGRIKATWEDERGRILSSDDPASLLPDGLTRIEGVTIKTPSGGQFDRRYIPAIKLDGKVVDSAARKAAQEALLIAEQALDAIAELRAKIEGQS